MASKPSQPATITGLQAFRGEGAPPPRGFWADAWEHVVKQPAAVVGLVWVGLVALVAIYAPLISSGHPLLMREIDRRTAADAAAWFRDELTTGATGAAVREGATVGTARSTLSIEMARHAGAPEVSALLAAATPEGGDDRPLTLAEVERLSAALRASTALDATGQALGATSPLLSTLTAGDWAILTIGTLAIMLLAIPGRALPGFPRSRRIGLIAILGLQSTATIVASGYAKKFFTAPDAPGWAAEAAATPAFPWVTAGSCAALVAVLLCLVPTFLKPVRRVAVLVVAGGALVGVIAFTWRVAPGSFEYMDRERRGEIRAVYTLIPWSSNQRPADRDASTMPPGTTHDQALANVIRSAIPSPGFRASTAADVAEAVRLARELPLASDRRDAIAEELQGRFGGRDGVTPGQVGQVVHEMLRGVGPAHILGTDKFGQDVLAQILHACRLAMSMGLVATGLATLIGVTMGALMGYFGGWVDLLLYRVVEMFMAIPVLFLLIVAAGVLERNTYVMMAIIGCVTWHGAARFTRAEFMRLRSQDFVQSARAVGLPLPSILFKHMLPNGVTPVLVDASFGIAAAILFEAVLSYLGLGPPDQPSWGRVLADSAGESGTFNWWLGVFPGAAIFLTVLSLTMVGEALRDAIDPKLKKARV